jgi:hypothetical protein
MTAAELAIKSNLWAQSEVALGAIDASFSRITVRVTGHARKILNCKNVHSRAPVHAIVIRSLASEPLFGYVKIAPIYPVHRSIASQIIEERAHDAASGGSISNAGERDVKRVSAGVAKCVVRYGATVVRDHLRSVIHDRNKEGPRVRLLNDEARVLA